MSALRPLRVHMGTCPRPHGICPHGWCSSRSLLSIPSFAEFYRRDAGAAPEALPETSAPASPAAETTPEERIETAFAALTTALREDLIARILQNTPSFFE